jgi:lipopolysaccharide/colanic/teichoic acid biosynthesis glycosyltransferase
MSYPEQQPTEPNAEVRPMRILMLTQWFDPEPTFKGLLFAQELQRLGHDVQVLTGFPNYPGGHIYDGYRIRLYQRESVGGVKVVRVPLYPSHDRSAVRRILNYVTFALSASIGAMLVRRPDVLYVYHPPATVGLPALALKLLKGVPYVYDVQDLWPDSLAATGMLNCPFVLRAVEKVMQTIYLGASRIVVLSQGFRTTLVSKGVPERRIDVIPNWADERQIELGSVHPHRGEELGFDGKFTVTFAGNLGRAQGLGTILDAAEILRNEKSLRFLLVGGGLEAEQLREEALRRKLTNVDFLPRRPISQMGEILTLSDALIVHLKDVPLFRVTVPSKTQAYLMAGRPILMGVRGDAAQIIADAGAGVAFEPENPRELASAVRRLMNMDKDRLQRMGQAGRTFYQQTMALSVGTRRFAQVFNAARKDKPFELLLKRLGDISGAALALVIFSVPMLVTAAAVKLSCGSPVVFRQQRPGKDGVPFQMMKFRTMTDDRDSNGTLLPDADRLTATGAFLRSASLDELPELWNVLRGEMSLVGPRPLLMRYTRYFSATEATRLDVRPGITGLAQINGRNTASWDERLAMDVQYVSNFSLLLDVEILVKTVGRVFRKDGVVVDPESVMQNLDDERSTRPGQ